MVDISRSLGLADVWRTSSSYEEFHCTHGSRTYDTGCVTKIDLCVEAIQVAPLVFRPRPSGIPPKPSHVRPGGALVPGPQTGAIEAWEVGANCQGRRAASDRQSSAELIGQQEEDARSSSWLNSLLLWIARRTSRLHPRWRCIPMRLRASSSLASEDFYCRQKNLKLCCSLRWPFQLPSQ